MASSNSPAVVNGAARGRLPTDAPPLALFGQRDKGEAGLCATVEPGVPSARTDNLRDESARYASVAAPHEATGDECPENAAGRQTSADHVGAMTFMSPIFHFTAHDVAITAMEHNNHCKLLALATSQREIYITQTLVMPVMESLGAAPGDADAFAAPSASGARQAPAVDVRLLDWSPSAMTTLVDRLDSPCVQLQWAPWQHGVYLAALCPGRHLRVYRYSHDRWALDAVVAVPSCVSFAFSHHFTIACACDDGGVRLLAPRTVHAPDAETWAVCSTFSPTHAMDTAACEGIAGQGRGTSQHRTETESSTSHFTRDAAATRVRCLCVAWDDSGSLLAVGRSDGVVSVVWVGEKGGKVGEVVYKVQGSLPPASSLRLAGRCVQVAWSPSSGRSFLALALAHASRLSLALFARPRQLSLVGLPQLAAPTRQDAALTTPPPTLRLLASTSVVCKGVVKLAWNTTGTRFVTSHVDNTVHVWSMCVRHEPDTTSTHTAGTSHAPVSLSMDHDGTTVAVRDGRVEPATRPANGGAGRATKLSVSIEEVTSVHPYHDLSMR